MTMDKTEKLRKAHKDASEYVAKVGGAQSHFRPDSGGKLSELEINTEVCHQAAPGATNYWKDSTFDAALERVVKARFSELAKEALALMKTDADTALLEEETMLRTRLAEVEAVKATA
jgi:hypothetical protein